MAEQNRIDAIRTEDPQPPKSLPGKRPTCQIVQFVPGFLVGLRVLLGPALLWDAWDGKPSSWFLVGVALGFLSDIYDGILARHWGISTARLRQADSWADIAFYSCIMALEEADFVFGCMDHDGQHRSNNESN